jgi:AraC family transcriptional regulator of arabinose operon
MENEVYGFLNIDEMNPSPLRVCDFGIECRRKERYDFKNEQRGNYEGFLFQYTIDGYGRFEEGGNEYDLSDGKAFFISFPCKSRYYLPKESEQWHYFFIHFTGEVANYFYHYIKEKEGEVFSLPGSASCVALFMQEFQAVSCGKKYDKYENGEFLYRFLTALCKDIEKSSRGISQSLADNIKDWLQSNYMTGKNIADMSDEFGVSAAHLTRQFHACFGMPPVKYLNNLRMEHAMFLLINTNMPIHKIALQSGFSNSNYYSKVFRKAVGMEPSRYRETFRQ